MSMVADIASISAKENGNEVEAAATITIIHLDIRSVALALFSLSYLVALLHSLSGKNAMNNLEQRVTLLDVLI